MKNLILIFIAVFFAVIYYGCSGSVSPEFGTYQNTLKTQLREMENVLNAGHYSQFISTYVEPSYISNMGGPDQVLQQFSNRQQQQLYKDIKIARNIMPLYNEKKKEMTYVNEFLVNPVVMKLINGKWYLAGDWFKYY